MYVCMYVNRQVESSTPSDQQLQRRPDGQKFDDDVAQKEGDGWLSEDAADKNMCSKNMWQTRGPILFEKLVILVIISVMLCF